MWKTIRVLGYALFLFTLYITSNIAYDEFNSLNLVQSVQTFDGAVHILGYLVGLYLFFLPSLFMVKLANRKIQ